MEGKNKLWANHLIKNAFVLFVSLVAGLQMTLPNTFAKDEVLNSVSFYFEPIKAKETIEQINMAIDLGSFESLKTATIELSLTNNQMQAIQIDDSSQDIAKVNGKLKWNVKTNSQTVLKVNNDKQVLFDLKASDISIKLNDKAENETINATNQKYTANSDLTKTEMRMTDYQVDMYTKSFEITKAQPNAPNTEEKKVSTPAKTRVKRAATNQQISTNLLVIPADDTKLINDAKTELNAEIAKFKNGNSKIHIYYQIEDGEKIELTNSTYQNLNMTSFNVPMTITSDKNQLTLNATLPDKVNDKSITYTFSFDSLTDFVSQNSNGNWYLLTRSDVTFNVELNSGSIRFANTQMKDLLANNMQIGAYRDNKNEESVSSEVFTMLQPYLVFSDNPNNGKSNDTFTIYKHSDENKNAFVIHGNPPRYDTNGNRINYTLQDIMEKKDDKYVPKNVVYSFTSLQTVPEGVDEKDYFIPTGYQKNIDRGPIKSSEGSGLKFTIGGDVELTFTQYWEDGLQTEEQKKKERPDVTVQVWRSSYDATKQGVSKFENAALARYPSDYESEDDPLKAPGLPVFYKFTEADKISDRNVIELHNKIGTNLPKYDTTGELYIYFARETFKNSKTSTNSYGIIFGKENNNKFIRETVQEAKERNSKSGNEIIDGSVISNRYDETVVPSITVSWNLESFIGDISQLKAIVKVQSQKRTAPLTEDGWEDVSEEETISGFSMDNRSITKSTVKPRYDENGKEFAYRYVLVKLQNGDEDIDYSDNVFSTTLSGVHVNFLHEEKISSDYLHTDIVNSIQNEINYRLKKTWKKGGKDIADTYTASSDVVFGLYRSINGVNSDYNDPIITFKSKTGNDVRDVTYRNETYNAEKNPVLSTARWRYIIKNLPQFDEYGRAYGYSIMEVGKYHPENIETTKYGIDYDTVITNVLDDGGTVKYYTITKQWLDGSDYTKRQDLTFDISLKSNPIFHKTVIIKAKNDSWFESFSMPSDTKDDDIIVKETKVGEINVSYPEDSNIGKFVLQGTSFEVSTMMRNVTVGGANNIVFNVNNRRVKTLNINTNKSWIAGDNEKVNELYQAIDNYNNEHHTHITPAIILKAHPRDASVNIEFKQNVGEKDELILKYEDEIIKYPIQSNETLQNASNIKGKIYVSLTKDDFINNKQNYSFYGLPFYDLGGTIIDYQIQEGWIDGIDGNYHEINTSALDESIQTIWKKFVSTKNETSTINQDSIVKNVSIKNQLSETRSISWKKQWRDYYSFTQGTRPDLYLNIYQVGLYRASKSSEPKYVSRLYRSNYRWSENEVENGNNLEGKAYRWEAHFDNLPKYNDQGYEVTYYATENLGNSIYSSYYAKNYLSDNTIKDYQAQDSTTDNVNKPLFTVASNVYGLREGETFVNILKGTTDFKFKKQFTNIPDSYETSSLPEIDVKVIRYLENDHNQKEEVGIYRTKDSEYESHQIKDKGNDSDYSDDLDKRLFTYTLVRVDNQQLYETGNKNLPEFDEYGRLYHYGLDPDYGEKIYTVENAPDNLYETNIKNTVFRAGLVSKGESKITNSVTKNYNHTINLNKIIHNRINNDKTNFKFIVYRAYKDITTKKYKLERVTKQIIIKANEFTGEGDVSASGKLEDQPQYAPNGEKYYYYLVEATTGGKISVTIDGQTLNANVPYFLHNYEGRELNVGNYTRNPVSNQFELTSDKTVQFENRPANQKFVKLNYKKKWVDADNFYGTRPQSIQLKLERSYVQQPEQGNQGTDIDFRENLTITGDSNEWEETTGEYPMYAPNGMPYTYRISEEQVPDGYRNNGVSYAFTANNGYLENDVTILKPNTTAILTNSISSTYSLIKQYQNELTGIDDYKLFSNFDLFVTIKTDDNNLITQSVEDAYRTIKGTSVSKQEAEKYFFHFASDPNDYVKKLHGENNKGIYIGSYLNSQDYLSQGFYLPNVIVSEGKKFTLTYKFVERQVNVYKDESKIYTETYETPSFESAQVNLSTNRSLIKTIYYTFSDKSTVITNVIPVYTLSIKKQFSDDGDNIYGTRPSNQSGKWNVNVRLSRIFDGNKEKVKDYSIQANSTESNASITRIYVPSSWFNENNVLQSYTYQFDELSTDNEILNENDTYYYNYQANYTRPTNLTVSTQNTLITNTYQKTSIQVKKKYQAYEGVSKAKFRFILQYSNDNGETYQDVASSFKYLILDGTKDTTNSKGGYETNNESNHSYEGIWNHLPIHYLNTSTKTKYRVIEDKNYNTEYIANENNPLVNDNTYSFTNTILAKLTINKKWLVNDISKKQTVKVGVYSKQGETEKLIESFNLPSTNTITKTYPYYDNDGNVLSYYARELAVGENTQPSHTFEINYEDKTNKNQFTTTITNIELTSLHVTKIWKDNIQNGGRGQLRLTISRTLDGAKDESFSKEMPSNTSENEMIGEYTYTGLPLFNKEGKTYQYDVNEESLEGYKSEKKVTTSGITFTNTKYQEIYIEKKVTGDEEKLEIDKDRLFDFSVTLYKDGETYPFEQTFINKGNVTINNNVGNFKLKDKEYVQLYLPEGISYEIEELSANKYHYHTMMQDINGNIDTQALSGKREYEKVRKLSETGGRYKVVYTNDLPYKQLVLNKTWEDNYTNHDALELTVQSRVNKEEAYQDLNNVEIVRVLNTGNDQDIYKTEKLPVYDVNGKKISYQMIEGALPTHQQVITESDDPYSFKIKNVAYQKVTLSKKVTGNYGDKNKVFTFNIKLTGTSTYDYIDASKVSGNYTFGSGKTVQFISGEAKVLLKDSEFASFYVLPGLKYEITEIEADKNHYKTSIKEDDKEEIEATSIDNLEATADNDKTIEFINDCPYIQLKVNKKWIDNQDKHDDLSFTTKVKSDAEEEKEINIRYTKEITEDKDSYTSEYVPVYDLTGNKYSYEVTETSVLNYHEAPKVKVDDYQFEMKNVKDSLITIKKVVKGNDGDKEKPFHFKVILTGNGNNDLTEKAETFNDTFKNEDVEVTFNQGKAEFTLKDNQSITLSVPSGLTYSIEEVDANTDYYHTDVTDNGNQALTKVNGISEPDNDHSIVYTNTRAKEEIIFHKTWKDKQTVHPDINLKLVRYANENDQEEMKIKPVKTVINNKQEDYSFGSQYVYSQTGGYFNEYRIYEDNIEGYTQVSYESGNRYNTLMTNIASTKLLIKKQITGNYGNKKDKFKFEIQLSGKANQDINIEANNFNEIFKTSNNQKVTFIQGKANFTLTDEESLLVYVPSGIKYEVKEIDANTNHYKTSMIEDSNTSIDQTNYQNTASIDDNHTIVFVNEKEYKEVTFHKTWKDTLTNHPQLTFKVEATSNNETKELILIPTREKVNVNNEIYHFGYLPIYDENGNKIIYQVSENPVKYYDSYQEKQEAYTFNATNVLRQKITLTKQVVGEKDQNKVYMFSVAVSGKSPKVNLQASDINEEYETTGKGKLLFKNGKATFTLKNEESVSFYIPIGMHYQIKEINTKGYIVTINNKKTNSYEDTCTSDQEKQIIFVNTKEVKQAKTNQNKDKQVQNKQTSNVKTSDLMIQQLFLLVIIFSLSIFGIIKIKRS